MAYRLNIINILILFLVFALGVIVGRITMAMQIGLMKEKAAEQKQHKNKKAKQKKEKA